MPSRKKKLAIKKATIGVKKSYNPFEVRVNRKKHHVIGQKSKSEVGKPGISRSKSIQKRKKTLLQEYKQKNKSNQLVDRRFGEKDTGMSMEEKLMQRFVMERKRKTEQSVRFNLTDEDEDNDTLTHYGQSIGEMTDFDYVGLSDEDIDEDFSAANFGGFMKKKRPRSSKEEAEDEEDDNDKSRKQILNEIVAKSKQMKYERQSEKMEMENLMVSVDSDWNDVRGLLSSTKEAVVSKNVDDYDQAVRELQFERRGHALDRMKTEEELAAEEKERLEKLEADRIQRMKGLSSGADGTETGHVSADFMRDSGAEMGKKDARAVLRYVDGMAVLPAGEGQTQQKKIETLGEKLGSEDEQSIEDAEEDEEEEEEEQEEEEEDEEEEEEEEDSGSEHDSLKCDINDLLSEEEQEEEDVEAVGEDVENSVSVPSSAIRRAAALELPYTFTVPKTLGEWQCVVEGRSPEECLTAAERIHSCNHPSLSATNKKQLEGFLPILLDYCLLLGKDPQSRNLETLEKLVRPFYRLARINTAYTSSVFLKSLGNVYRLWTRKKTNFPQFACLFLFKLVGVVFSVSDFKHPVATPAVEFMGQVLVKSKVTSKRDLLHGLLVCQIMLKYIGDSKRLIPELINFLTSSLGCFCETSKGVILPPFSSTSVHELVASAADEEAKTKRPLYKLVVSCYGNDQPAATRSEILDTLLDLILRSFQLYKELPSFPELFSPLVSNLSKLADTEVGPVLLKEKLESTANTYNALATRPRPVLTMLKQKPKSINFYEPKFDAVYEPDRRKHRNRTHGEKQKLQHKLKREMKGAVREIRRDTTFIAKVKLDETLALDAERRKKTRQLLNDLQGQQHETKLEKRRTKKP